MTGVAHGPPEHMPEYNSRNVAPPPRRAENTHFNKTYTPKGSAYIPSRANSVCVTANRTPAHISPITRPNNAGRRNSLLENLIKRLLVIRIPSVFVRRMLARQNSAVSTKVKRQVHVRSIAMLTGSVAT